MPRNVTTPKAISRETKYATAILGRSPAVSPDAATICGEGVSPAASAAASGSPPGRAAATLSTVAGRADGSVSRQRRMTRSITGLRSLTTDDGRLTVLSLLVRDFSGDFSEKARLPVKTSYSTSPRE